ncbi:MAG: sigma-70 family RNA polymerase sigma factor [Flavobacteriales bacterium]|nr:sigma-70 family RNA polymerase sigma factor [Flavobacteriales bacterium]
MSELSDKELLELFRQKDRRHYAFDLLVRQYQERLYNYVRRMVTDHQDAEDVLQNVFIKAWRGLDKFREDAQLFSWLYRIAHNESITHLKRVKRGLFVDHEAVFERLTASLDHGEQFSGDAIERKLQRAVMRLPEKQRSVFTMKYFQEMKYHEISAITGTSIGALKSSYHIAVRKIEEHLTSDQTK